jgi:lipid A ethanolaminephosphotransferase
LPECTSTTLGQCEPGQLINSYDNTIVATDHFLAGTIAWLQRHGDEHAPALLYMSDHGESLGELGIFLHGMPYAFAPEVQKRVPFIAWFAPTMVARRGLDVACVGRSLATPLSHDNLFHSVLGLLDVTTPTYRAALDAFAACRNAKAS